jgi:hypothetical protein
MNDVWILINEARIYVYIKGKDMKIISCKCWLKNINPVQLRSSIKFLKEVYTEFKQIKYKNWGFDTYIKGMDMDI